MSIVSPVSGRGVPAVAVAAWLAASAQLVLATPLRSPDPESASPATATIDPSVQRVLNESLSEHPDQPLNAGFRHGESVVAVPLVTDARRTSGTPRDLAPPGLAAPINVSTQLDDPRTAGQIYSEFGILAAPDYGTNDRAWLRNVLVASSRL